MSSDRTKQICLGMTIYIYLYINDDRPKTSKFYPEITAIAEYFCCCNTITLLIKLERLIQISLLFSVKVRLMVRGKLYKKFKIKFWLRTIWANLWAPFCSPLTHRFVFSSKGQMLQVATFKGGCQNDYLHSRLLTWFFYEIFLSGKEYFFCILCKTVCFS